MYAYRRAYCFSLPTPPPPTHTNYLIDDALWWRVIKMMFIWTDHLGAGWRVQSGWGMHI